MIQRNEANLHINWQKELANVVTCPRTLLEMLGLSSMADEKDLKARALFPVRVPVPFIKKMRYGDINDPLLLQVMPRHQEFIAKTGFDKDPLKEQNNAQPGLLHKYKSRVLVMFKTGCAVNCRYCFRRHFPYQENQLNKRSLIAALDYIKSDANINEVILSGGDPLMAKDDAISWFMDELEQLPQIKRMRIHSRLPVVIPSRITDQLCERFAKSPLKIVFINHINHGNEIDDDFKVAMQKLKKVGVTLLNQAVLLKDVNDTSEAQVALSEALFDADVLPYYLYLLDKVEGASHFDIDESQARKIMAEMLIALPGFLVPKLMREIGGQKSKTPIDLKLL
ncbi:MAG: EF-P beta-lysylation protein EpmB [Pseudoalteromonas rhizosphaerae]|jgi:EF-P beta-lysylation protein EpmB|uniref:L-lysine 2,3-aminomutase n=1 Tax=Pseudoalteromonas rhizosphaerae TaxID=2518973 RepID=A0ABW8KVH4_9GAMM|nr:MULTISPECIES: EF-P beta-lysylation protein EpmB [Pseudoalteromonas]MBB1311727.1 EF-P beta-lysylation protein EpmB [Pseudoalteromonas sp. SR41-8]MBB1399502.1 EF-P beta-lysylation protein EpmB [Pseudoalteromonas sp. SG44-8]MBB1408576.1 EF-P beta-lysylation protein EpmB [Pseudoalteromonas sp. SG44-17]MBB1507855.1 EF-P beta-lysylation protein EpmB [Pseudoalteromonas sp. SG41-1]|tara:strand:- start:6587 stop:7600 length:1014 start_codon:yes stop_codon:yes gene_type:complete